VSLMNSQFRKVAPASVERRMATRHAVSVRCMTITRLAQKPHDAQLGDLSKYGCRVFTTAKYSIGENVLVWHDDEKLGCRFDNEMELQLFRQLTLLTG
jgi:hypothetical protein